MEAIIMDNRFSNNWIPRNHIGFKEWAQEEIGTDADLESDFHPSTAAHKIFYEKIIKPKIKTL